MNAPRINAPGAIAPAVEMLRGFLDSQIAAGTKFQFGQTIQCGWMWFKIGADGNGDPIITAPKTGSMPMQFSTDCSDALNLVLTQRYVCDSFGVESDNCHAVQSAIVIKDIAYCKKVFIDHMDDPQANASGWFFGASDSKLDANDPNNLELRSLWQLACEFPRSRDFLLLPVGWQVLFDERPIVFCDHERMTPIVGSYYAEKYGG